MAGWLLTPIIGCLGSGLLWLNWLISFASDFQCGISMSPHVCFILDFILIFIVSMMIYLHV